MKVLENSDHKTDYPTIGRVVVNAQPYNSAVTFGDIECYSSCSDYDCFSWVDYNLNYEYAYFESPVGLDDKSTTGTFVTFKIIIDGDIVKAESVGVGETKNLAVSIPRGFRMRLEVSGEFASGECGMPVFADPKLIKVS